MWARIFNQKHAAPAISANAAAGSRTSLYSGRNGTFNLSNLRSYKLQYAVLIAPFLVLHSRKPMTELVPLYMSWNKLMIRLSLDELDSSKPVFRKDNLFC